MDIPPVRIGQLTFDHAEYDHDCDVIYLYNGHRFPFDNDAETAEGHMVCSPEPGPEDEDALDDLALGGQPRLGPGRDDPWPDAGGRPPESTTDLADLGFDPASALDRAVPKADPAEVEPEITGLALLAPRQHVRDQGRVLVTLPTTPPRIIEVGATKIEAIIATAEPITPGTDSP